MLKLDEDMSKGCVIRRAQPMNEFLDCKSILRYLDDNVDEGLYDLLEDKIAKTYANRQDLNITIGHPLNNKKMMNIWITLNFKENEDCGNLTETFMDEFEQSYEKFKKETEKESQEFNVGFAPSVMGPRFRR